MPLYIVQAESGGPLKIGFARCINKRVAELECGSPVPLRLLGAYDCSLRDEQAIHRTLKPLRVRREWYRPHRAIQALMCALPEVVVPEGRCPAYPRCEHDWRRKPLSADLVPQPERASA